MKIKHGVVELEQGKSMETIVSIGEVLWDVFPNGKYLGGAPFNYAANCARLGHRVLFVSAVGNDPLGEATVDAIQTCGVTSRFVRTTNEADTGIVQVDFDGDGQPDYTIVRPAAYDFIFLGVEELQAIANCSPAFLYFGTLSQMAAANLHTLRSLIKAIPKAVRFYDVNLRRDSYSPRLLEELLPLANVVKLNLTELEMLKTLFGSATGTVEQFCRHYSDKFGWKSVWVTRGSEGCAVFANGNFREFDGFPVQSPQPVGAGDAFSAAVCHGIRQNWSVETIATFANKLGALVASQPGAIGDWSVSDIELGLGEARLG